MIHYIPHNIEYFSVKLLYLFNVSFSQLFHRDFFNTIENGLPLNLSEFGFILEAQ